MTTCRDLYTVEDGLFAMYHVLVSIALLRRVSIAMMMCATYPMMANRESKGPASKSTQPFVDLFTVFKGDTCDPWLDALDQLSNGEGRRRLPFRTQAISFDAWIAAKIEYIVTRCQVKATKMMLLMSMSSNLFLRWIQPSSGVSRRLSAHSFTRTLTDGLSLLQQQIAITSGRVITAACCPRT